MVRCAQQKYQGKRYMGPLFTSEANQLLVLLAAPLQYCQERPRPTTSFCSAPPGLLHQYGHLDIRCAAGTSQPSQLAVIPQRVAGAALQPFDTQSLLPALPPRGRAPEHRRYRVGRR